MEFFLSHQMGRQCRVTRLQTTCGQGYEPNQASNHFCSTCPRAYYKDKIDNSSCIACPASSTTLLEGATKQSECQCLAGFTGPGGGPCLECEPGYYNTNAGQSSCVACEKGKYSGNGASSCFDCPSFSMLTEDDVQCLGDDAGRLSHSEALTGATSVSVVAASAVGVAVVSAVTLVFLSLVAHLQERSTCPYCNPPSLRELRRLMRRLYIDRP